MQANIITYDFVDSTMDEARRLLSKDFECYKDAIIIAKRQSNGRGRQGRQWISPEGNLYMSMIVKDVAADKLSQYALMWGLVLYQTISYLVGLGHVVQTKWPNDILINEKKVGGILIERHEMADGAALVVGIGMNIVYAPKDLPFSAISLDDIGVAVASYDSLIMQIHANYWQFYQQWQLQGFSPIRERWLKAAWRLKQSINIRQAEKSVIGIFETIDLHGAIEIRDNNGLVHRLLTGDVFNVTNN